MEDFSMKKFIVILFFAAVSFLSCNKEISGIETISTDIIFDLSASYQGGLDTKAVKTGWESGDVLYVFFNNVAAPKYLKMSFNGSSWTYTQMNGAVEESLGLAENATGTMRAVYLPFGNSETVSADGSSFVFSNTYYSYFLTATLGYTVVEGKVSGAFDMQPWANYIQFYLDDASADPAVDIELREPHLRPWAISSISADGSITMTSQANGAPLKGYVYDKLNKEIGESKGYLFSGYLAAGAQNTSTTYQFTLVVGGWQGTYYQKTFEDRTWYRSATEGRALKMPAVSNWTTVTDYKPIDLGTDVGGKRIYWSSRNLGATVDFPAGTGDDDVIAVNGDYYAWGDTEPYYEPGTIKTPVWKTGKSAGYYPASYKYYDEGASPYKYTKYNWDYGGYRDLQPEDDAARVNLGGNWHTPTESEWSALLSLKKAKEADYEGWSVTVSGGTYWVDPTIFFPYACRCYDHWEGHAGYGDYWASRLHEYENYYANCIYIQNASFKWGGGYGNGITAGLSVRPVTE